jgi:hypothetical protein
MSITFRDYNDHSSSTYADPTNTAGDPNAISITKATPTELDYAISEGGVTYTIAVGGQFDLSHLTSPLVTMADANAAVANNTVTGTVNSWVVTSNGTYVLSQSYSPGLSLPVFSAFQDGNTLASFTTALSGNDVYYTSSTATPTGGAWNAIYLYGGNDTFYENHVLMTYNDIFYGGDGIDTAVLPGKVANYNIQGGNNVWDSLNKVGNLPGYYITDTTKVINTLQVNQIERLSFSDTMVALDNGPTQTAGSVYMLYQATFNRTPDAAGLGYWINAVDKGANIITNVAASFVTSPEFVAKYGSNPSNASYVDNLYQNVLHRAGESGGVAYWNQQLNTGAATKAFVLEQFATLAEGAALVAPAIAHGIQYQQWVG